MDVVIGGIVLLIIAVEYLYFWLGKRKKVIDQFESDVRIFLVVILILSFYSLFLSVSLICFKFFTHSKTLGDFLVFVYFLVPPFSGVALYAVLPWLYERHRRLTTVEAPDVVREVSRMLGLHLPEVKTTPQKGSPSVYGRSGRGAVLVLPTCVAALPEDEEKAVLVHELSHIRQGDVGFFTWLTYLMKGLTYWVIPFPLVSYYRFVSFYMTQSETFLFIILFYVFFFSLVFLKSSLSRTRESIADAYAVFHGFSAPLKRAIYTVAVFGKLKEGMGTDQRFYRESTKSLFTTHPRREKRFRDIEEKTYLKESISNLSFELALWVGTASAFLYYTVYRSFINFSVVFDVSPSDSELTVFMALLFCAAASVVAASYTFPLTKATLIFENLGHSAFLRPFFRNCGITIAAAALISYGLTFSLSYTRIVVETILGGFLLSMVGIGSARRSDFSHGEEYLAFIPALYTILLWYPLHMAYSFFMRAPLADGPFAIALLSVLALALAVVLVLMVEGQFNMVKNDKLLFLFGKKKEFPGMHDILFVIAVLFGLFALPVLISFGTYVLSCFLDSFNIIPVKNVLMYGICSLLLVYGLRKSDILYFFKLAFLVDLAPPTREDVTFVGRVIQKYQFPDGGFDYAGIGYSNQKDTFYVVKTARKLGIHVGKVVEWIESTECKDGGFSFFTGGLPRVEGLYYAIHSLLELGVKRDFSHHVNWVFDHFNGEYFTFEHDTCSPLLQTCYAVESLSLLTSTQGLEPCIPWIESHFQTLTPREAFLCTCTLRALKSDMGVVETWLEGNQHVVTTRVDKNMESLYYYVNVLRMLHKPLPSLVVEEAARELTKTRREYERKF